MTRRLPGPRHTCPRCKREVVVAITVAGENGPGGKHQFFEPFEDPAGRVAIVPRSTGARRIPHARALKKGETHDTTTELLGMPHHARCQPTLPTPEEKPPTPPNVVDFAAAKARKGKR